MGALSRGLDRTARASLPFGSVIAATILTAGTVLLIWFVAVPWGSGVCPAVYPAPGNCSAVNRAGSGLVASIVVLVVYVVTLLLAVLAGRRSRGPVIAGVVLLALAPVVAYAAVAFSPGFPLHGG